MGHVFGRDPFIFDALQTQTGHRHVAIDVDQDFLPTIPTLSSRAPGETRTAVTRTR
jgi:hypothetical protein